ncbi:hypothetical protein O3795_00810 [Haemophilus parahaemolyticus]|uniref:Uncharacterized protein n=2 Tax=Haemophilus parahaemolyticus TaxID=735 RepID=A0A369ZJZ0_HAEPH|nr:hypothetical protein [Haemophilus parahaemolyticus]RDE82923.1 hypothetical protein DPV86_03185 [Haemophilus parahaemolyticus]RDF04071.1 hypothetical protein DPV98_06015 [Haemophilus parahaemolyticus]
MQASPKPNPPMLEEEDELEMIPYYEIYASAGYGSFNLETYQPDDYIGLNRKWLNQRGFRINHLRFFQAEGIQCIQRLAITKHSTIQWTYPLTNR